MDAGVDPAMQQLHSHPVDIFHPPEISTKFSQSGEYQLRNFFEKNFFVWKKCFDVKISVRLTLNVVVTSREQWSSSRSASLQIFPIFQLFSPTINKKHHLCIFKTMFLNQSHLDFRARRGCKCIINSLSSRSF